MDAKSKKAFRQMWVGGTLGVYFTAVVRKLLTDVFGVPAPAASHTGDLVIRYGYVLWFLFYFFVSNLRLNKEPVEWDLSFDVIQATIGLTVVFALGFLDQQQGYSFAHQTSAIIVSNAGIIAIAALASFLFRDKKLNFLRLLAVLVAVFSGFAAYLGATGWVPGVSLLGLWLLLGRFIHLRLKQLAAEP